MKIGILLSSKTETSLLWPRKSTNRLPHFSVMVTRFM